MNNEDKLNSIIVRIFKIDESAINDEMSPETIPEWDSMNYLMFIADVEEAFNIKFTMDEVMNSKTLGDIRKAIRSKTQYRINIVEEKDTEKLSKFFKEVYSASHICTNDEYLAWQYKDIPNNQFFPKYSSLVFCDYTWDEDGKILAHLGLIPYKFKFNGNSYNGAFMASLVAGKEVLGHGAGVLLIDAAETFFDFLYTTGFNKQAEPALKQKRWEDEKFLQRWVIRDVNKITVGPNNIEEIKRFEGDWSSFLEGMMTIERTAEYLNWRFIDNPFVKYKIFGVKGEGYIVLRKEEGNEYSAVRIVDFVSNQENAKKLFETAVIYAKEEGADFVDFFCSSDRYADALIEVGFEKYNFKENPEPPTFILPTDKTRFDINYSYKIINPELKNLKPEDWYIVKSDGDKDRPY